MSEDRDRPDASGSRQGLYPPRVQGSGLTMPVRRAQLPPSTAQVTAGPPVIQLSINLPSQSSPSALDTQPQVDYHVLATNTPGMNQHQQGSRRKFAESSANAALSRPHSGLAPASAKGSLNTPGSGRSMGSSQKRRIHEMEELPGPVFSHEHTSMIATGRKRRKVDGPSTPRDYPSMNPGSSSAFAVQRPHNLQQNLAAPLIYNPQHDNEHQGMFGFVHGHSQGYEEVGGAQWATEDNHGSFGGFDAAPDFAIHPQQNSPGFTSTSAAQLARTPGPTHAPPSNQTTVSPSHHRTQNVRHAASPLTGHSNPPVVLPLRTSLHTDKRVVPTPAPADDDTPSEEIWNGDESKVLANQGERALTAVYSNGGQTCMFERNDAVEELEQRLLCNQIPLHLATPRLYSKAHHQAMNVTRLDANVTYLLRAVPAPGSRNAPPPVPYKGRVVFAAVSSASQANEMNLLPAMNELRAHLHNPAVKREFIKVSGGKKNTPQAGSSWQPNNGTDKLTMTPLAKKAKDALVDAQNAERQRAAAAHPPQVPNEVKYDWASYNQIICQGTAIAAQLLHREMPEMAALMEYVWYTKAPIVFGSRLNRGHYSAVRMKWSRLDVGDPDALDHPKLVKQHPGDEPALYTTMIDLSNPAPNQTLGNVLFTAPGLLVPRAVNSALHYSGSNSYVLLGAGVMDSSLPIDSPFKAPIAISELAPFLDCGSTDSLTLSFIQNKSTFTPRVQQLTVEYFEAGYLVNLESIDQQFDWAMRNFIVNEAEYRCFWSDMHAGADFLVTDGMRFCESVAAHIKTNMDLKKDDEPHEVMPSPDDIAALASDLERLEPDEYARMFPYFKNGQWFCPSAEEARKTVEALENPNPEFDERTQAIDDTIPNSKFRTTKLSAKAHKARNKGPRGSGVWIKGDTVTTHEGLDVSKFDPDTDIVPGNESWTPSPAIQHGVAAFQAMGSPHGQPHFNLVDPALGQQSIQEEAVSVEWEDSPTPATMSEAVRPAEKASSVPYSQNPLQSEHQHTFSSYVTNPEMLQHNSSLGGPAIVSHDAEKSRLAEESYDLLEVQTEDPDMGALSSHDDLDYAYYEELDRLTTNIGSEIISHQKINNPIPGTGHRDTLTSSNAGGWSLNSFSSHGSTFSSLPPNQVSAGSEQLCHPANSTPVQDSDNLDEWTPGHLGHNDNASHSGVTQASDYVEPWFDQLQFMSDGILDIATHEMEEFDSMIITSEWKQRMESLSDMQYGEIHEQLQHYQATHPYEPFTDSEIEAVHNMTTAPWQTQEF